MNNYDYNFDFIWQRGKQRRANNEWIDNKSQEEKPFAKCVEPFGGVECFESLDVLRLVFVFGLPREYFKILCYSIQIVYERNPICSNASC